MESNVVQPMPHEFERSHRSERDHPDFPIGCCRNPPACSEHTRFRGPSYPTHFRQLEPISNRLLFCRGDQWRNFLSPLSRRHGVGIVHHCSVAGILCDGDLWQPLANHPDSSRSLPLRSRRVFGVSEHLLYRCIVDELAERLGGILEQLRVERRDDL